MMMRRGQLLMVGQSSILLPGRSVGILQRHAAIHEHIHHCRGTVLGSVPVRLYGFGLGQPGPTLQHSQVVARWLGAVLGVG